MPHWKLTLAYDGTNYAGWQVQPGVPTVQGTLQEALRSLLGESVLPQGSGRTDAGVHALAQVASFATAAEIPSHNLHSALNRTLPQAIRVTHAETVPATFHARHSATAKTYEYRLFPLRRPGERQELFCPPFLAPFVWACRWPLELAPMNRAAAGLLGKYDFTSFAASDPDRAARIGAASLGELGDYNTPPSNIREIRSAAWTSERDLLIFRVTGSGFLHHMVRNLVGTLVDVGRGSLHADVIPSILAAHDRSAAGPTAPAQGLFLHSVEYTSASNAPGGLA